jgi:hypothetical protein
MKNGHGYRNHGIATDAGPVGRAVQRDKSLIDRALVEGIMPAQNGRN